MHDVFVAPLHAADHVLKPSASNKDVFTHVAKDIVRSVVNGYNGTIFAYGQTAAGKTWTMQGDKANPGVLPQAIMEITSAIAAVSGCCSPNCFSVRF